MPRYRRPPLTLPEVWRDGGPVRVRDLTAITELSDDLVRQDIADGRLLAYQRGARKRATWLVTRPHARDWLTALGYPCPAIYRHLPATTLYALPSGAHATPDHMGLGSLIRSQIKVAHQLTGGTDGVQVTVTHRAWTGIDGYAKPTYDDTTRTAVLDYPLNIAGKGALVRTRDGEEKVVRAQLTFLAPIKANGADDRSEPVDPRDLFVMPDGSTASVLQVGGTIDPTTDKPFALEVLLG